MADRDISEPLQQQVMVAAETRQPLLICGGGSKRFYGRPISGDPISTVEHSGMVSYEPQELVVTVRSGTPLTELEAVLADAGQMLPFEPPHLGEQATIGGSVATALAGPCRPWRGGVRESILGCEIINGRGERLTFGGRVLKNVAGYDVSRLMVGAQGTLGLLLEVSLRLLPRPAREVTLVQECDATTALTRLSQWRQQPLPLSGAAYLEGQLWLRLSGSEAAVTAAQQQLGGEPGDDHFWSQLREQQLSFFAGEAPLWRLALPADLPNPHLADSRWLIDWGGGQRWLRSAADRATIQQAASALGGHATCYRAGTAAGEHDIEPFTPLPPPLLALQQRLRQAFDPGRILNRGRLYAAL